MADQEQVNTKTTKKKFYKKWWFWVVAVVLIVVIASQLGSDSTNQATDSSSDTASTVKVGATSQAKPEVTKKPDVPVEYLSALAQAETYANEMHMSKKGVYNQLVSEYGEKFKPAAAQYAVDHVKSDWNANALASAKNYQTTMHMSPAAIHDQLTSSYGDQFTKAQADYAIKHLND